MPVRRGADQSGGAEVIRRVDVDAGQLDHHLAQLLHSRAGGEDQGRRAELVGGAEVRVAARELLREVLVAHLDALQHLQALLPALLRVFRACRVGEAPGRGRPDGDRRGSRGVQPRPRRAGASEARGHGRRPERDLPGPDPDPGHRQQRGPMGRLLPVEGQGAALLFRRAGPGHPRAREKLLVQLQTGSTQQPLRDAVPPLPPAPGGDARQASRHGPGGGHCSRGSGCRPAVRGT
mmetsp:Transcript_52208/g.154091  ORF Transcript_52208/g.154091 Transcript_52208/m.154091 type:complete len:235 (-) Transcript_52208:22-726(-)